MLDLGALEALARAATPGPWRAISSGVRNGDHWYVADDGEAIAYATKNDGDPGDKCQKNATYIAAVNPAAVLELIKRLRAAEPVEWEYGLADDGALEPYSDISTDRDWILDGVHPIADALLPLIREAQAEALREAADEADRWVDEDAELGVGRHPSQSAHYAGVHRVARTVRQYADRIEQNNDEKGGGPLVNLNDAREARGWQEAAEYAPDDEEAQDDFMTGWRAADRAPAVAQTIAAELDKAADELLDGVSEVHPSIIWAHETIRARAQQIREGKTA